jgi:hypothetical protein
LTQSGTLIIKKDKDSSKKEEYFTPYPSVPSRKKGN